MNKFTMVVVGIFIVLGVVGVVLISTHKGSDSMPPVTVSVWGPFSSAQFELATEDLGLDAQHIKVKYKQVSDEKLDQTFINALAEGKGPDLFFLPQDQIVHYQSKLTVVPYTNYPQGTFQKTFTDEGELFATPDGILGVPVLIDPLIMYWNKTLFANVGQALPPVEWDEYKNTLVPLLTKKDADYTISQSTLALGTYNNITNASAIISALIIQAGSPITYEDPTKGLTSVLQQSFGYDVVPAVAALTFYTGFSDPVKPLYSWSSALPSSQDFFLSNNLATYFGFASELPLLQAKNPNLNFGIVELPQPAGTNQKVTYGKMYGLAIPKISQNVGTAFTLAVLISNSTGDAALAKATGLAPSRRDLLAQKQTDAYSDVFYKSALIARGWLEPSKAEAENVLQKMIDSITSGRARIDEAVAQADATLSHDFK